MEIGEVEAIEEGKIVKVTEDYAVREGLPIIRRQNFHEISNLGEGEKKKLEIEKLGFDELRKPLNWREKQKVRGLVDNFHWHISRRRREMGLNRGQVAEKVGESEEVIKAMENGIIPNEDIGLISKMEDFLGISLRKGADEFSQNMRALIENAQKEKVTNLKLVEVDEKEDGKKVSGSEIDLFED